MAVSKSKSLWTTLLVVCAAAVLGSAPVAAQIQSVDPDAAIDGDLVGGDTSVPPAQTPSAAGELPPAGEELPPAQSQAVPQAAPATSGAGNGTPVESAAPADDSTTYHEDDLIGAAEGVFGKGAEGLADMIKGLLKKQGEPNAYIVGREGGGAFVFGLRYGSGTLYHKVEGTQPVYWTGPSLGFDAGANAGSAFILVYNLYDTEDLFHRYGAGEGQAYLIGGFHVSYLRRGDVVLIPVRMGAGLRLGANIGYMKFSHDQNWMPF